MDDTLRIGSRHLYKARLRVVTILEYEPRGPGNHYRGPNPKATYLVQDSDGRKYHVRRRDLSIAQWPKS
jgi:hypothetical protein